MLYIEYQRGRPFSVVTARSTYDLEWCKRDGLLYYEDTGSGAREITLTGYADPSKVRGRFWAAPGVKVMPAGARAQRRLGYARRARPRGDPFVSAVEGQTHYCTVCNDHMPCDDLCTHVFHSERTGQLAGPGDDLGTAADLEDFRAPCLAFVRAVGCTRTLRRALRRGRGVEVTTYDGMVTVSYALRIGGRSFDAAVMRLRDRWHDDDFRDGANWVRALGPATQSANAATLRWLDALIAEQDARRAAGVVAYFVGDEGPMDYAAAARLARERNAHSRWSEVTVRYVRPVAQAAEVRRG